MPYVTAGGTRLAFEWIGPGPAEAPTLVFLHQGLGCSAMWRDFAARLAEETGCGALLYDRRGYGGSDPLDGPHGPRFMHDEALVTLPQVLSGLGVSRPFLVGHSDGASIALLHAGAGGAPVSGLLLEAPHVFVEDVTVESIERIRAEYATTSLPARLARYHGPNTEAMFRAWNDVWLSPEFRPWNIEPCLDAIECPVLVIQGEEDEYGTRRQVEAIVDRVAGAVVSVMLPGCGHSPHRDQPDAVLRIMARFVRESRQDEALADAPDPQTNRDA